MGRCHRGKAKDDNGVWGNWQPAGFWFRQSRFESWYPSEREFDRRIDQILVSWTYN